MTNVMRGRLCWHTPHHTTPHHTTPDRYWAAKERIVALEQDILRLLAFDVDVTHPYEHVVVFAQALACPRDVLFLAMCVVNDSYSEPGLFVHAWQTNNNAHAQTSPANDVAPRKREGGCSVWFVSATHWQIIICAIYFSLLRTRATELGFVWWWWWHVHARTDHPCHALLLLLRCFCVDRYLSPSHATRCGCCRAIRGGPLAPVHADAATTRGSLLGSLFPPVHRSTMYVVILCV